MPRARETSDFQNISAAGRIESLFENEPISNWLKIGDFEDFGFKILDLEISRKINPVVQGIFIGKSDKIGRITNCE